MTNNRCIPFEKNKGAEVGSLFMRVKSYVLSAAHKFDLRPLINETHNKWCTVERSCSYIFMFLIGSVCSPPTVVTGVNSTYALQVNCSILSKGQ